VRTDRSGDHAWDAALSGLAAVAPEVVDDEDDAIAALKRAPLRREVEVQLRVIPAIDRLELSNEGAVAKIRKQLTSAEFVGEAMTPHAPSPPPGRTNQELFEQYRAIVTSDSRNGPVNANIAGGSVGTFVMILIGAWSGRYARRRSIIDGTYGRLADSAAPAALVARQRKRNAVASDAPRWDEEAHWWVAQYFDNRYNGLDVRTPGEPTSYGPSLWHLWTEAKSRGASDERAWESLGTWAVRHPESWAREDARKKRQRSRQAQEMQARLESEVTWTATGNVDVPWSAMVNGERWEVRLNDFPDEVMYTLIVDGVIVDDFHDWPPPWRR
jgi:hypothetical protein